MEHERKELLAQKRAQLKIKQKRAEIQQYKDRLTKSIEHFSQKYRYADEAEALKIETFISKLNFEQPGQLALQEVCPYPHGNLDEARAYQKQEKSVDTYEQRIIDSKAPGPGRRPGNTRKLAELVGRA